MTTAPDDSTESKTTSTGEPLVFTEGQSEGKQVRFDDSLIRELRPDTRSDATSSFEMVLERVPTAVGLPRETVRGLIAEVVRTLPEGWSTPRHVRLSAEPYEGRFSTVIRLIRTDIAAAEGISGLLILLRDRVLPTLRRFEDEGASREDLCDIVVEVVKGLPASEAQSELAFAAVRFLLAEPDPTRRTAGYFVTLTNLGNSLIGPSRRAELESSAVFERSLLLLRQLQETRAEAFEPRTTEATQVRIGAHNLAAGILRLAQASDLETSHAPNEEARRLEVLSAAFAAFDHPPPTVNVVDLVESVGLSPFLVDQNAQPAQLKASPIDPDRAMAGLLVAERVGSIGKSAPRETIQDAYISAVSGVCACLWTDSPARAAARFYNGGVSLNRVRLPDGVSGARSRAVLFALGLGAAFLPGDLSVAVVENDALSIASALADTVQTSSPRLHSASADRLLGLMVSFARSAGLTNVDAGALRGDAVRLDDLARRLDIPEVTIGEDLLSRVVSEAAAACAELLEPDVSVDPPWSAPWLTRTIGTLFSGGLDPSAVDDGLMWDLPAWIDQASDARDLLLSFGTSAWRRGAWESPMTYAGLADRSSWEELLQRLLEPAESAGDLLAHFLQGQ